MLPKDRLGNAIGVVVVLNPLDALGNNQVTEKLAAGFTAINLTKPNFTAQACRDIQKGVYNFVYLSPKIFLDNQMFSDIYFSPKFQSKLALVVVDEAHMIYAWGLVESGQKKLKTLVQHQDFAAFRPCYGSLAIPLLTRNGAPLLLMSATCRPAAITAIKKNLKLLDTHFDILRGELTRPEIRIIRLPMTDSIQSCDDILKLHGPKEDNPDEELRTLQVLEALDRARGTPGNHLNPRNSLARRYHACTGELDKQDTILDFAQENVPILSCTLALGMGQNWKLVRQVVHIGRGDPSLICQMVGRCGCDGCAGLAILFVEPNRPKGKNSVADFTPGQKQSDEDRMDALAVTPVCLWIAFSMDNLSGYIPLDKKDPLYQAEVERERITGFPPSVGLTVQHKRKYTTTRNGPVTKKHERLTLKQILTNDFQNFFEATLRKGERMIPSDLFGKDELKAIVDHYSQIESESDLRRIIKGEALTGQLTMLMSSIRRF
ncbi:hypothetical protein PTTG_05180 [Puccinia triticina 1-1 BBBD Race 1]|uniref:DNA 3'-5' helicase n=1 Tax=Puccinia triticina (isolate 1-1 / race 1 (BBBD)) TaxID=630390 RepID=A0A180GHT8_PUCT1|nr:hypothetical protein PTTG_05180 [Puccinia triticina 1-1 BBBD Race 1]